MLKRKPKKTKDQPVAPQDHAHQTDQYNEQSIHQDTVHPISESLTKKPKKSLPSSVIAAIIGLIILIIVVLYMQFKNPSAPQTNVAPAVDNTAEQPAEAAPAVTNETAPAPAPTSDEANTEGADTAQTADNTPALNTELGVNLENIPDPKEILSAPIPESEALAKEEIQRLADEEKRLKEQEALLIEQVEMMDELNEKKAEQIALLEQQISQLEQQKNTQ